MRILSLITGAALLAVQAHAALEVFPLKDVRAGMHGTGRTVFNGDKIEEFQVEVLGVLENVGPKQSIILARLSGGPLDHTGIMQGMSGSPVYLNGKLAGAVALAFPYAKDPIAGIRPIEEMLASSPAQRLARNEAPPFGESRLTEVATPISFNGFSASTVEHFTPELRKLGLEPRQGISTGGSPDDRMGDPSKLQPGSMISVQLMTGDMSAGADGTLTAIDEGKIYAFGHKFLGAGPAEMPFTRSEVMALLANVNTSFKISSAREMMGVITGDRLAAITGVTGRRAAMLPVEINVTADDGTRTPYKVNLVRDSFLSPYLTQMAVFSAIDSVERTAGPSSVLVDGAINLGPSRPPVRVRNLFSADQTSATAAATSVATPLAYLMQSGFTDLNVERITLDIRASAKREDLTIGQVWLSRKEAKPGETVSLFVQLDGDGAQSVSRELKYTIPTGTGPGTLYFTVADGAMTSLTDLKQAIADSPRSSEQVITNANRLRSSDKAYVRVWRPQPSYGIGGDELPDPPPSVALVLAATQTTAQSKNSKLDEMQIDSGDRAVTGSKTVQIEIKDGRE